MYQGCARYVAVFFIFACTVEAPLPPEPPEPPVPPKVKPPEPPIVSNRPLPSEELSLFEVENFYDVADSCEQMVNRHAQVREIDMEEGTLTWRCGDVPGIEGDERGKEYCEYFAVSNGQRVDTALEIGSDPLYCMFTSVFLDTEGRDEALAQALSRPENLGAPTSFELPRMKHFINSREAATGFIDLCSQLPEDLGDLRQAACFQASVDAEKEGDIGRVLELEELCRGHDLLQEPERFEAAETLGARIFSEADAGFEQQREIFSCMTATRFNGIFWRNADMTICGRSMRAGQECGCDWDPLPNSLEGFIFTPWITPTNGGNPRECRLAKVDGEKYPHIMLCEIPQDEVALISENAGHANDLRSFCNDRFGTKLSVKAPLRAVEQPGTCQTDTEFCQAFTNTP